MDLPPSLRLALSTELTAAIPKALAGHVGALSARYRDMNAEPGAPFVRSAEDAVAYTAYRMPATFAAVYAALSAFRASAPDLRPSSLLDIGAGPGTALWAATGVWPELSSATLFERDERMIALGRKLARHAPSRAARDATWRRVDVVRGGWDVGKSALVVSVLPHGRM